MASSSSPDDFASHEQWMNDNKEAADKLSFFNGVPDSNQGALKILVAEGGAKKWLDVWALYKECTLYTFNNKADSLAGTEPIDVINLDGSKLENVLVAVYNVENVFQILFPEGTKSEGGRQRSSTFSDVKKVVFQAADQQTQKQWTTLLAGAMEHEDSAEMNERGRELAEVRTALGADAANASEKDLFRFLKSKSFNVTETVAAYQAHLSWRRDFGVEKLNPVFLSKPAADIRSGKIFIAPGMTDKHGRPVVVFKPALHDAAKHTVAGFLQLAVFMIEGAIASLPSGTNQIVLLVDLANVQKNAVDPRIPRMAFGIIQANYPGRIAAILYYNQPWFFKVIWSFIGKSVSPDISNKLRLLGSGKDKLRTFFDEAHNITEFGGNVAFDFNAWLDGAIAAAKKAGITEDAGSDDNLSLIYSEQPASEIQNPDKVGWMTKQGQIVMNWKKRWFVLKGKVLLYYEKENSAKPSGSVVLDHCTFETGKKGVFHINTASRNWHLQAPTEDDMNSWIAAFKKASGQ